MSIKTLPAPYELLDPAAAPNGGSASVIRNCHSGELFLFKCPDAAPGDLDPKIRLKREMNIVASLDHPNIAKAALSTDSEALASVAYHYRKGQTLSSLLKGLSSPSPVDALHITRQILRALEYLHARGVIHGALCPDNIYIDENKGVQLFDFSAAMTFDEAALRPQGGASGALPYLSPEQMGSPGAHIDERSDLYCTALVLYRMLSGKLPFEPQHGTAEELLSCSLRTEVEPLRKVHSSINAILLKALKPVPSERYQTASGFKHDIVQAIDHVKNETQEGFVPGLQDAVQAINCSRIFVGRGRETDMLNDGLAQLLQGRAVSYCIYGKSGSGKSETIREFKRTSLQDGFFFITAQCHEQTPLQPYSILRQIVVEFIANTSRSTNEQQEALSALVGRQLIDYSGLVCKIIPESRALFGEVRPVGPVEPDKEAGRTAHVLFTLLSTLCSFKPLVLAIDDLQWIDRCSFEIVARTLGNAVPCMMITALHTDQPGADLHVFEFDLHKTGVQKFVPLLAFTRAEVKDFVLCRFGETADIELLVSILVAKTDCSPFALAEACRFLVNNSSLTTDGSTWSIFRDAHDRLPEKLDPQALILQKTAKLKPEQLQWLEAASLTEGKIRTDLIGRITGLTAEQSGHCIERLEMAGLIVPQLGGGHAFPHPSVRECVRSQMVPDERFALYEKLGAAYETMAASDKECLYFAAESYFKSKNLSQAMALGYGAAKFAAESGALDLASRYFATTQLMASQCARVGVTAPFDTVPMQIEFGNVLLLTGRGEQAVKVFDALLKEEPLPEATAQIDIKQKLGVYYHTRGDFDRSMGYFIDALRQLHISWPADRSGMFAALFGEWCKRVAFALGLKGLFPKIGPARAASAVRILNGLSSSFSYKNAEPALFAHLKALNIADRMDDGAEKAMVYARHALASRIFLRPRRAVACVRKAAAIAERINRKDVSAYAEAFGGLAQYCSGNWKNSEQLLRQSIAHYSAMGDEHSQDVPLSVLVFLNLQRGRFSECGELIRKLGKLELECKDRRGAAIARVFSIFVNFLSGKDSYIDWATLIEERGNAFFNVPIIKALCDLIIANKLALNNQLKNALEVSDTALEGIRQHRLLHEYVAGASADRCGILIKEFRNRTSESDYKPQLALSSRDLLKQLRRYTLSALASSVRYPAHRGAAYRAAAWYCEFRKHSRIARRFFRAAAERHHNLDMQFEEARSLREFGHFLEDRHQPGLARDCFNEAYLLFEQCGVPMECIRLREKVDRELAPQDEPPKEHKGSSSDSASQAADQIRVDTLYDACVSLAHMESMDTLLRQIVFSLIKATGAQYGFLCLDGDQTHETRELALNFDNHVISKESITYSPRVMQMARKKRRVILTRDPAQFEESYDPDQEKEGSVLCVPFIRDEKYFGCVYLTNTLVVGLFSLNSAKAAQIISAQASFLIENAYLMEEYKRLNARLEQKVKEQTRDISDKNDQLLTSNLKLVESERMKDLLSGTIVHDIKNYAAGISGNLKLLSYKYGGDNKTMRSIGLVNESCTDIVTLASNLLDINKMEEGKLTLQARQIYFEELAAIAQKYSSNVLFDEKKVAVKITPPSGDFAVIADPYLIERVIQNLFSNAAKYTEAGGSVEMTFEETVGECIMSFLSSGAPIPADHHETIFEKYTRVDGKTSRHSKGLGLFFCKVVMNAHQGRIWLETGKDGNCFRLGFRKY